MVSVGQNQEPPPSAPRTHDRRQRDIFAGGSVHQRCQFVQRMDRMRMRLLLMSVSIRMGRYGSVWGMSQKRAKDGPIVL
ncbi:hypothetical protein HMPREF2939_19315 [Achromobacter xylosoxidans]|nr:hypothetical protein HMPREF2939_19315 [Achromobacter xylosoxidans]